MFETVKELWRDYICLHESEKTRSAVDGVTQATEKFDAANIKMEGAVMHLILNGNGHTEAHVKPKLNGAAVINDDV